MKNCQILELARKQAGIADGVRYETFAAWKRAGLSVRKGEKAAFSAKINCQINGKWCMTEKAYFTEDQVEPLTARPSRRGKDTAPVSEPAPAVAVPSVAVKETETAPAPVAVELAPVVPVVAPSNPTRPLIKAGDDQNGTYFGISSDGSLVTIATYETHDLSIERVEPSVSVQTETAPVVDAPADPDPMEEEEPAPVLSEPEEEEPAPSFRVAFEVRRYVAHLKWSEIGNGMTAQQVYNAVVNKASRQGFPSGVNRYELDTTADAVTEYDRCKCRNDIRYRNGNLWGYTCVVTALYCVTYTTAEEWDNAVMIDWRALPVAPLGPTTEPLQLAYC